MAKVNGLKIKNRVGVLLPHLFYCCGIRNMSLTKILFLSLMALSALTGCQKEAEEIILPLPSEAFTAKSVVAGLIERTTMLDGSSDNILDSASCASLVLPVTVLVNGQEVTVTTEEDLKYVERILDEFENYDDEVNIIFPVTIVLADHSLVNVQNEDELESIMDQCAEGGVDDDIECIDFNYPLTLAIYNTNNQVSDVITIDSDTELYEFIDALEEGELISFEFPVVMQLSDGTEITVYNNDELEDAIENATSYCDEDDDTDFDDDDIDDSIFITALLTGPWKVNYFFKETNQTAEFASFSFTFNTDGTVQTTDGVSVVEGTWNSYGDDGGLELLLDLGEDSPFNEIREDWEVIEFNDTTITLKDHRPEEMETEPVKTLIFQKL